MDLRPFRRVSPGSILGRELEARRWTAEDFAKLLGCPLEAVLGILGGTMAISLELAESLSRVLGTSAEFWVRLEARYGGSSV